MTKKDIITAFEYGMLREIGVYRFFTSFRMTHFRFAVILSRAKNLYESTTENIM